MKSEKDTYYNTVITPDSYAQGMGLKELWQKKYLIWLFIKRDLTVQFKQTIFGFGWYFISPLFTMFMYVVVFGRIAGIPTDDIPQPVFYLSGIALERTGHRVEALRKILPKADAAEVEHGLRDIISRYAGDAAKHDDIHEHREKRRDEIPPHAENRLLELNRDITLDKQPNQVALLP